MTLDTPEAYDAMLGDLRALVVDMPRPLDVWGKVVPAMRRRYTCPSDDIACALADRLHEEFDWGKRYAL
jgi:hypothetical protein